MGTVETFGYCNPHGRMDVDVQGISMVVKKLKSMFNLVNAGSNAQKSIITGRDSPSD